MTLEQKAAAYGYKAFNPRMWVALARVFTRRGNRWLARSCLTKAQWARQAELAR